GLGEGEERGKQSQKEEWADGTHPRAPQEAFWRSPVFHSRRGLNTNRLCGAAVNPNFGPHRNRTVSRNPSVLSTGASGEIGHGLIARLAADSPRPVVTLDLNPLSAELTSLVRQQFVGSILDTQLLERIIAEYEVDRVYHLAALLSTRSEFTPALAHKVNVEGTLNLLEFAQKQGESHGRPVVFFYPSSIAAYGPPDLATKTSAGRVPEGDFNFPTTMYGANKLYCEHLGRYYARHYKQLAAETLSGKIDFRCVRFPGLISAETVPSGG